jgi:hypothetical protein
MAEIYFCSFMKSKYVSLMKDEEENNLESWVKANENAMSAICDIEVIQQFSSWLCHHARRDRGEILKLGSILDILSSTKKIFNSLFPNNPIFDGNRDQRWYTTLRAKSNQEIIRRDIKRGVMSTNKSKPVGRVQMKIINETLLGINSHQSIRKAVYAGTTFNSAGRSGEAAYMCLDDGCYWDHDDEKLYFFQKEMKVGEEKNNNFVSDSESYLIDQYWLFSVYYILGGGSSFVNSRNSHGNFVFPELYDKESGSKGSTATYISSILKDLMPTPANKGKVTAPLLWDSEVTGTSLRRGSTRVMVRKVSMQAVVSKTGHDMKGARESSVWEYIDGDDVLLGYGSAALAAWPHPENPVYPPTLRRIFDDSNQIKLNSLCSILFDHSPPLTKMQNIKGLVYTMLGTFLMYLEEFLDDCSTKYNNVSGNKNVIHSIFEGKIEGLFTMEECLHFGALIREEWEERNCMHESTSDVKGLVLGMERVQAECLKIRCENRELKIQLNALKEETKKQNSKLSTIMNMLEKLSGSPPNVFPNLKRSYSDMSAPIDQNSQADDDEGELFLHI